MPPPAIVTRDRLDAVESAMIECGWTMNVERKLAKQLGVTRTTIRRIRAKLVKDLASRVRMGDRNEERADFLQRLRAHQQRAEAEGAHGPVSGMLALEARIMGIEEPQRIAVEQTQPVRVEFGAPLPSPGSADAAPPDDPDPTG